MTRVHLRFVRPSMTLAEAVVAPDGSVVAGIGTRLGPAVVRLFETLGLDSVRVDSPAAIAPWEEDPELAVGLARLEERFAAEAPDPVLDVVRACLRDRLIARAGREAGRS